MGEKIAYTGSASITDGPTIGFARSLDVGSYEKLTADIAAKKSSAALPVGVAGSSLRLLLIRSSAYDANLTFFVDADSTKTHALIEPVVIAGAGVLELFGKNLSTLTFANGLTKSVTIEILVARDTP
jgi:hypothetical protein